MKRRANGAENAFVELLPIRGAKRTTSPRGPTRGRLEELLPDGHLTVRVRGDVRNAAIAVSCSEDELLAAVRTRRDVLVVFMDDEPHLPVIVGILRDRIEMNAPEQGRPKERFVNVEATEGIRLRSGESSLELHADGRVELRGVEVVSIADGTNRLMGARVAVN